MRSVLSGSGRSLSEIHAPCCQRDRQSSVAHQLVVKLSSTEAFTRPFAVALPETQNFPAADGIAELVGRPGAVAADLGFGTGSLDRQVLDHIVDRLGW